MALYRTAHAKKLHAAEGHFVLLAAADIAREVDEAARKAGKVAFFANTAVWCISEMALVSRHAPESELLQSVKSMKNKKLCYY